MCAESATEGMLEDVKEVILHARHPWNGQKIKDIDISRQTVIILVDRDGKLITPTGEVILLENDKVLLYTKESIRKYQYEPLF